APPTVDEACNQFGTAICAALEACGPALLQYLYGTMANCVSRQALGCSTDQTAPGTGRTTTQIVACAQAVPSITCSDLAAGNIPDVCQPVPGTVINGAGCGSSAQCQSTHCEKPDTGCGTCAPRQPAAGNCTSNDGCNVGLVCANNKCVTPGAMGAK